MHGNHLTRFTDAPAAQLTKLNLSQNALRSPLALPPLPALQHLNLGSNQLSSLDFLSACPQLRFLRLSYNQVSQPTAPPHHQLEELILSHNQVKTIPLLDSLPRLRRIDLEANAIRHISAERVASRYEAVVLDANPLRIFERSPEAYDEQDWRTYHHFLQLCQQRYADRHPTTGKVYEVSRKTRFHKSLLKHGANGVHTGTVGRLKGAWWTVVAESPYEVGRVEVRVSIRSGLLRVRLRDRDTLVIPRHPVSLSGYLSLWGEEEHRLRFESLSPEVEGLRYEVRMGKARDEP